MKPRITLIAAACALALAACGNDPAPADTTTADTTTPTTAPDAAMPGDTAATDTTAPGAGVTDPTTDSGTDAGTGTAADAGAGSDQPAAVVTDCSTVIEGTDTMRFSVGSITVPSSCSEFTITLNHIGKLPEAAMGHNVVITTKADMQAVAAAAIQAGVDAEYIPADDARVIAHTDLIGGGESTSITFPVSDIQGDGPYGFFCSFPGHSAIMKGTIAVE